MVSKGGRHKGFEMAYKDKNDYFKFLDRTKAIACGREWRNK
jgi:hypothetical protein